MCTQWDACIRADAPTPRAGGHAGLSFLYIERGAGEMRRGFSRGERRSGGVVVLMEIAEVIFYSWGTGD